MKQLFERALQLEAPWRVLATDFDFERQRVDVRVGFGAVSVPQCERVCEAVDFTEGTWRQPDAMAFGVSGTADRRLSHWGRGAAPESPRDMAGERRDIERREERSPPFR